MTFNINWDKRGVYVKFRGIVTAQDLIDANNYVISNANFETIHYQILIFPILTILKLLHTISILSE